MMLMTDLTLEDLVNQSQLPIRTLRYYIQEGLLPGPDTRGKYATYSQETLDRLKIITQLKDLRLPLREIKQILDSMTPDDVRQMVKYQSRMSYSPSKTCDQHFDLTLRESDSALDYIHNLTQAHETVNSMQLNLPSIQADRHLAPKMSSKDFVSQDTWQRIKLKEGIELHLKSPIDKETQEAIDKLIQYSRKLF